jgi:signal transduction histidine kinase
LESGVHGIAPLADARRYFDSKVNLPGRQKGVNSISSDLRTFKVSSKASSLAESNPELVRLTAAFEEFNRTSTTLQRSYEELQAEARLLSVELANTNAQLERSLAEKERVESELREILASLSNGVLVIGLDKRVNICNPAALHLLALPPEATSSSNSYQNLAIPASIKEMVARALESDLEDLEIELRCETGPHRYISVSSARVFNSKQQPLGTTIILKDVTRLKELERETQRAQKLQAMGEMAVQLAHEIRNPLGGIELFASLLGSELQDNTELKGLAEQIVTGVKFLNTIVTNMLTFTRSSRPHYREFDLKELILDTLSFVEPIFQQRHIVLEKPALDEPIWVDGDPEMLRQMLINLLMNGLQAIPEAGRLSVRLEAERREYIEIEIEDTGTGIPPENIPRIFDPFFTTNERGTGLGLSLVHQIVEKHHGKIVAKSEFGSGTQFTIWLPRHAEEFSHVD